MIENNEQCIKCGEWVASISFNITEGYYTSTEEYVFDGESEYPEDVYYSVEQISLCEECLLQLKEQNNEKDNRRTL